MAKDFDQWCKEYADRRAIEEYEEIELCPYEEYERFLMEAGWHYIPDENDTLEAKQKRLKSLERKLLNLEKNHMCDPDFIGRAQEIQEEIEKLEIDIENLKNIE